MTIARTTGICAAAATVLLASGLTACSKDDDQTAPAGTSTVHVTVTDSASGDAGQGSGDGQGSGGGQGSGDTTAAGTGQEAATQVVTVIAVGADGQPRDGWSVSADAPGQVQCGAPAYSTRSATTGGMYDCTPNAAGAHTCWPAKPGDTGLLCAFDPWETVLHRFTADAPLTPVTRPDDPWPWALELADGTRCTLRYGGAWGGRSDDLRGAYGCSGTDDVVLTEVNQNPVGSSAAQWTVRVGQLGSGTPDLPAPTVVGVTTAYFTAAEQ
ncbi:hypothetical protein [Gordonia sp. VNK21]|uniref:hypothetical protein n=1 Tax=Gordonia sp. VNK21 TaxID=3382483 RepID=UPI0038D4DCE6